MGRPPLPPDEARSVIVKVRLTPVEAKSLTARFGTPGAALRALVDADAARDAGPLPPALLAAGPPPGLDDLPDLPTAVTTAVTTPVKAHRHRRHALARTEYAAGRKIEVWTCECGQELAAT